MKCIISLFKMNPGNLISAWFCLEYEPVPPATTTKVFFFFVVGLYHLYFIENFSEYNSIFFVHCICHWHHLWWQKIQFSHRKMTLINTPRPENETFFSIVYNMLYVLYIFSEALFLWKKILENPGIVKSEINTKFS